MLIQRPALWLFRALGIVRGTNPSTLSQDVSAVLDIGQGGWGQAAWKTDSGTRTTNGVTTIVDTDLALTRIVWINLSNAGPVATTGIYLYISSVQGLGAATPRFYSNDGTWAQGYYTHTDICGSLVPIILPPGFRLQIQSLALTASGNTHAFNAVIGEMPAGYKPW